MIVTNSGLESKWVNQYHLHVCKTKRLIGAKVAGHGCSELVERYSVSSLSSIGELNYVYNLLTKIAFLSIVNVGRSAGASAGAKWQVFHLDFS